MVLSENASKRGWHLMQICHHFLSVRHSTIMDVQGDVVPLHPLGPLCTSSTGIGDDLFAIERRGCELPADAVKGERQRRPGQDTRPLDNQWVI